MKKYLLVLLATASSLSFANTYTGKLNKNVTINNASGETVVLHGDNQDNLSIPSGTTVTVPENTSITYNASYAAIVDSTTHQGEAGTTNYGALATPQRTTLAVTEPGKATQTYWVGAEAGAPGSNEQVRTPKSSTYTAYTGVSGNGQEDTVTNNGGGSYTITSVQSY